MKLFNKSMIIAVWLLMVVLCYVCENQQTHKSQTWNFDIHIHLQTTEFIHKKKCSKVTFK